MTTATQLLPTGRQRYFNNDGTPCVGGQLWTYAAGTTNPKTTWADADGTIPNANPITLDAHGECVTYWSGAYKVSLFQADGTQVTGYPVDNLRTDLLDDKLATPGVTDEIQLPDPVAPAFLKVVSDILNMVPVSVLRFQNRANWAGIKAGTSSVDTTAAFNTALGAGVMRLDVPQGVYNINGSIDARSKAGLEIKGQGLPNIVQQAANTPIFLIGGERDTLEGMLLKFAAMPAATDTNAVCVRGYNLYESILRRLYLMQCYTGIDQFQGLVNGAQNAFYSNRMEDLRIVLFNGWAVNLLPFGGGNSGNRWDNLYINNRGNSATAAGSGACLGGIQLKTAQNDVFNLINIEWMRNAGPAIVLNQAGNPVFNGLHFEGLYPTGAYAPLIDVPGGDKSCPTFNALTVTGCDWGGAVGQALIRLDNQGTRAKINGLLAIGNANTGNQQLLSNGGATCYGSFLEVDNANVDGSFAGGNYAPKVTTGAITANTEYPLQRYNQSVCKHSALVSDNAGGANAANGALPGAVAAPQYDAMGLYDAANTRFNIKQTGNYECFVTMPAPAAGTVIYVQKNYATVGSLTPTSGNAGQALHLPLVAGDNIEFYLAAGSYTRTNVAFGVALGS